MNRQKEYTRQELYDLVWTAPNGKARQGIRVVGRLQHSLSDEVLRRAVKLSD
jgi:hypothetical protein